MTDESPSGQGTGPRATERGLVLMADRSEEADSIAEALAGVGLSVLTCDVVALPERATRVDPVAILVDLEQANSRAAVERLQEQRLNDALDCLLIVLGTKALAAEMGLKDAEDLHILERPVGGTKLAALLRERLGHLSLTGLASAPASVGSVPTGSAPTGSAPTGSAPTGSAPTGSAPMASESDAALLSDFPAIAGLPEVAGILPELGAGSSLPPAASALSPEIESLLTASARRVAETDPDVGSTAAAADIPVPPEMMAMIDDLLAPDEPPETQGGMSLAAMIGRDRGRDPAHDAPSAPGSDPAPPPGSEPSFDSFGAMPTANHGAASSSHGSDPPKTGLDTSIAEEQTRVPHPSEPRRRETDTGPRSAPGTPVSSTTKAPSAAPQTVLGNRPPTVAPSAAASTLRGPEAMGFQPSGAMRPKTQPPGYGHLRPPSDRPPESSGLTSEPAPMTHPQRQTFSSRRPGDTAPPRAAYTPLQELEAPVSRELPNEGDPIELLAQAVRSRSTGALMLSDVRGERIRRVLMRDGDISNAASDHPEDALVVFLVERGDLSPEVARTRSMRLPHTGRHAAAALIANGFLGQDDLWPVLRAHAEWIISRALTERPARCHVEAEPPERLRAEPNVFGGAAGVEILLESVRRVLTSAEAFARLGGPEGLIGEGINSELLAESALSHEEMDVVRGAPGMSVAHLIAQRGEDFAPVLYGLAALGILRVRVRSRQPAQSTAPEGIDPLDIDAVRKRVAARLALVQDADYFSLLGVPLNATAYDIRRAYLALRRTFEPNRLITAATTDLREDVELIVEVLDEAYEILRDAHRRSRYLRAIEATRAG